LKELTVLYQDERIVAVNKPSGLLVHRSEIDRRETENAMKTLRGQLGRWVYPVHRLDKATSGVLLFALDRETARCMTQSFADRTVVKSYLAVVRGYAREADSIDHPLRECPDRMTDRQADAGKPAQEAVTSYKRLATAELPHPEGRHATARYSLVLANPGSGRKHQVRRHMKHVFHPVIGDTTYGDGRQNRFFRERFDSRRLLLHALEVDFPHPVSAERIRIRAPLDDGLGALFAALGWGEFPERATFFPGRPWPDIA
jgi:tRNA pseudouridine65 synthase